MKTSVRLSYATFALFLLPHFSSQDSTVSGGAKPAVNFYGTVTDLRESFKAENITIDRLYKAIPAYQQPPVEEKFATKSKDSCVSSKPEEKKETAEKTETKSAATRPYEPADNITRLDLSEISKITLNQHQEPRRFGSRDYIVIDVYSNDKEKTKNSYMIEADKRLFFDQINPAGPIEKEIKIRAIASIEIDGYKQQPTLDTIKEKKDQKSVKAAQACSSKTKRVLSYVKNALGLRVTL